MTDRSTELARIRGAAERFLSGEIAVPDFLSVEWSTLAEDGPLDGLLLDLFNASEAWEPPGPTRLPATEELRQVARLILDEGIR